jgi:selenocysteine lyase/cysteine desulfurase
MLSSFGIGALYIKKKYLKDAKNFRPEFFSQSGQNRREKYENNMKINMSNSARRFELGTPHFPNIIALNAAVRYISKIGIRGIERRILKLSDYLIDSLGDLKLEILSPIEERKHRSGIILFKARKKMPREIVNELEKRKIIVSQRGVGIRVSTHFYNNEQDVDKLMIGLKEILEQ